MSYETCGNINHYDSVLIEKRAANYTLRYGIPLDSRYVMISSIAAAYIFGDGFLSRYVIDCLKYTIISCQLLFCSVMVILLWQRTKILENGVVGESRNSGLYVPERKWPNYKSMCGMQYSLINVYTWNYFVVLTQILTPFSSFQSLFEFIYSAFNASEFTIELTYKDVSEKSKQKYESSFSACVHDVAIGTFELAMDYRNDDLPNFVKDVFIVCQNWNANLLYLINRKLLKFWWFVPRCNIYFILQES